MNVLLIQPPNAASPLARGNDPSPASAPFCPPWNLLCLRAFLYERTRHLGHLMDCRLFSDLETHLVEAIAAIMPPRLAVINTTTTGLGQASAVMQILKRNFPDTRIVITGQHPAQFPEYAMLSREDYALAGDAEPVLRNLLDYLDVPQRLEKAPGLMFRQRPLTEPYWLQTLRGLSLPGWDGIFWPAYAQGSVDGMVRAEARLSRGHSRLPADRAFGESREPLREWPFDQVALSIQKSLGAGVHEIFLSDPPGFWTLERLKRWCSALARCHNMQNWSLQLLPATLRPELVELIKENQCARIEFIVPSCDPDVLQRYHCTVTPQDLATSLELLSRHGISSHLHFWLGGPEESRGEADRVIRAIRAAGYRNYSLHPFPYHLDAPLYADQAETEDTPLLEDWIQWARDPWTVQRPIPLYGGPHRADQIVRQMTRIAATVERSPAHVLKKFAGRVFARNWIELMEHKAASLLTRSRPAGG